MTKENNMLTQAQLGAADAHRRHEQQQMDSVWSGLLGQLFFWACIVMTATSYCSSKVHEFAAEKRQAHSQAQVQKPARAAKLPASAARAAAARTQARTKG